jgi:hypothetical protein
MASMLVGALISSGLRSTVMSKKSSAMATICSMMSLHSLGSGCLGGVAVAVD